MITLKEVRKDYLQPNGERLRVLENISFEIAEGTFSSLLGPSGCGKSTILNLIARLDHHTSGDISVNGNKMGFVFQQPRLLN
jgi:ABC-type sugar transport system ATPase subunit